MLAVLQGLAIELDVRGKGRQSATDDRECHWQAQGTSANHGVGRTTHGNPDRERTTFLARIDRGTVQRWPESPLPGDWLAIA